MNGRFTKILSMLLAVIMLFSISVPAMAAETGEEYLSELRIVYADDMKGILAGVDGGNFVKAGWCGCRACEDKVKEETGATSRVIVEGESAEKCAVCGKPAEKVIIYARAY